MAFNIHTVLSAGWSHTIQLYRPYELPITIATRIARRRPPSRGRRRATQLGRFTRLWRSLVAPAAAWRRSPSCARWSRIVIPYVVERRLLLRRGVLLAAQVRAQASSLERGGPSDLQCAENGPSRGSAADALVVDSSDGGSEWRRSWSPHSFTAVA